MVNLLLILVPPKKMYSKNDVIQISHNDHFTCTYVTVQYIRKNYLVQIIMRPTCLQVTPVLS